MSYRDMSIEALEGEYLAIQAALEEKRAEVVEEPEPKVLKKFRCDVRAGGHFTIIAYDMYEADVLASQWSEDEIRAVMTWDYFKVNDDEYPEEV